MYTFALLSLLIAVASTSYIGSPLAYSSPYGYASPGYGHGYGAPLATSYTSSYKVPIAAAPLAYASPVVKPYIAPYAKSYVAPGYGGYGYNQGYGGYGSGYGGLGYGHGVGYGHGQGYGHGLGYGQGLGYGHGLGYGGIYH